MFLSNFLPLASHLLPPLPSALARQLAARLRDLSDLDVYPQSLAQAHGALFALGRQDSAKHLLILHRPDAALPAFHGESRAISDHGCPLKLLVAPVDAANAAALRAAVPYTRPQTLGLATSAGCGDRLGLATPGHIHALQGTGIVPILAQQSMRENARTGRSPQQVIDDATWGVFQEGWRQGYGADADHLKTTADIDICVAAGYTFFTIDPGDHVNNEAHTAPHERLHEIVTALPWDELQITVEGLHERYLDKTFTVNDDLAITFTHEKLARAAGKYGGAIAHTVRMYRHLAAQTREFELEMSVDETETVTSVEEHFFIASELRRLGVEWVSLAPRYVGRFEKGVDYIGDLDVFQASLARHAAIAQHLGPYKLSIHSGSDKFSVYPFFAKLTHGVVHLKTAGTSYLEALRAIARVQPSLFRRILALGIERYPSDRATYHVSAELSRVPDPAGVTDADLSTYLDQFDARQVLHVTYGSALDAFGDEIKAVLQAHEEEHYAVLQAHFARHLRPFV
ncbi:MAG: hypothetical protein GXP37_06025 [Chloroflexi bacterium]|nr:hypothetical protein [Chloroflexota bacterium]